MMQTQERQVFAAHSVREEEVARSVPAAFPLASIGLRCGALLLDYILVMLIPALTVSLALIAKRASPEASYFILAAGYSLTAGWLALNWIYLSGKDGQTVGKRILGIRLRRVDGAPLDFKTAALRHLIGYPLAVSCFGLGLLWALWDGKQQGWHDKLAGTLVVKDD